MTIEDELENEVAPTILRKPRIKEEDDGNRLLFQCQLISRPRPTVKWYKENRQITDYDQRISMKLKEFSPNRYLATLDINDVVGIDAGVYRIHCINKQGDVSASINLNFTPSGEPHEEQIDGSSPIFTKKPTIVQEDDGRILIFECKIQADPKPEVSWFHNNTLIEPKGRYKVTITKEAGTSYVARMQITDVAVEDAGKYKVISKNELGESNASISLNFDSDDSNIPDGEARPTFTEKPIIRQGDNGKIVFECRLVANPKPSIKWFHKSNLVKEDSRHKYNLTSDKHNHVASLEISNIAENESGTYRLEASNTHGSDEATINLNFDQGKPNLPTGSPPRFPRKPQILQVKGSLLLQCYLEANPFPEIAWFKTSATGATTRIQNSDRHKISDKSEGKDAYLLQLEIKNPVNEDGGTYRCNAANGLGESNANIALNFQGNDGDDGEGAPKFIQRPKIIPKEDGNLILMECKVKSAEKITVTWSKGGSTVKESSRIKQVVKSESKDEYLVYMEINSPLAADGGQYKCNVKNDKGEINANLTLNIEGDDEDDGGEPPSFIEKPKIIAENDGKLIKMECKVKSIVKPTISWTCDGEKISEGGRIQQILKEESTGVYHMKLELRNPILTDAGTYKCNVRNQYGEVNANLKLNIELAPVIKKAPTVVKNERKRTVIIEVRVESNAPPKVSWMKESTVIREDSRHIVYVKEVKKGEFAVGLEIERPEKTDKGTYSVLCKNEKGECKSQSVRVDDIEQEEEKKEDDKKKKEEEAKKKKAEEDAKKKKAEEEQKKKEEEQKKKLEEKKAEERKKVEEKLKPETNGTSEDQKAPSSAASSKRSSIADPQQDKGIEKRPSLKKTTPGKKELDLGPGEKVNVKRSPSAPKGIEPPMFIYQLKSLTLDENKSAKFNCTWESKEKITSVKWFYNKKEIKQSIQYSITNKDTTAELIVNKCVHESSGEYSVEVTNRGGTSESTATLTVKAQVEHSEVERKKKQSVSQQNEKDEEDKKKKSIDDGKNGKKSSVPEIKEPQDERNKLQKGVPSIQEPEEQPPEGARRGSRRGSFFDVNQMGQRRGSFNPADRRNSKDEFDPTDIKSTTLKATPNENAPRIFNYQENMQCTEGKTAYIKFDVAGAGPPALRFYKDGQEIYASGRYTLVTDGNSNTVYFCVKKSKPNDEGRYKVVASNQHGEAEAEIGLFIGGEEGVDFRALLKRGKTAKWAKKDEDPDWGNLKAVEDERRASLKEMQKPAVFTKPLQNQRVKEGRDKKVRFECVFSKIGVKGKWFKNNNELFPGKRYSMIVQGDLQILEILGPVVNDEGKYKCQCLDQKTEALLEVDNPDPVYKFTKPLAKESKGFIGREIILECTCNSSKAPVKWFKDNQKLEIGDKYFIESDTSGKKILRIQNGTDADSGTYSCKIQTNDAVTSTKLSVVEQSFKFMRVLRSMRINETEKINLECELDDASAEVTWYKNGKEITKDKHIDIQVDGKKRRLVIRKAKLDDEAKYECKAPGDVTEAEVLVEPLNRFKKKLKDIRTFENKKVVFEVELTDNRAQLKWLKDGKEIKHDQAGVQFKFHDDKHMMILNSCVLDDAGEYTAMINENIKSTCKLIVDECERPPVIKLDETEFTGHADKPFTIEIPYHVQGTRVSDIAAKLMKGGQPVNPKDIEVQVKPDKIVLYLKKPFREQTGPYSIELSNEEGKDKKDIQINVLDVPKPPVGPIKIKDIFKDRCKLSWEESPDTGGLPLLHYVIEKQDPSARGGWSEVGTSETCDYEVTGLTPGKEVKFRIKAVNKKGQSEPLTAPKSIIPKDPWDEPAKIENVEITDWDADRVDLKWARCENDGGVPLKGYIIECKDKFSTEWKKCAEVPADKTNASVKNLKENQTYEFRVRAENQHLVGPPSDPTKPLLMKARFIKPFIIGDGLKNLIVKKGATIKYDIKFKGEPTPDCLVMINRNEVKATSRIQLEITGSTCLLVIKNAVRADSGKYKLVLTNRCPRTGQLGECESLADVVVLDKSLPPEGPLILEEIRANSVKIKWRAPRDTGGQELKGYLLEKYSEDTGRWVPVAEVDANTTDFKVEGLTKDKKYKFRVKALNAQGESLPLESDTMVAKNPYDEPGKPGKPSIVDYSINFADLEWEAPSSDGGRPILCYKVQMKYNKGGSPEWVEVFKTDGPVCKAKIENLKEETEVEFRVIAENKAGPSEPSDSTGNHIVKYKNLPPKIDRTNLKNLTVKVGRNVKLEAHVRGEPVPSCEHYHKDLKLADDQFIKITNVPYHTTFEILNVKRKHTGPYTFRAKNRNGEDEVTVQLTVLGKPEKPNGPLDVSDVHAEGVTLSWKKPSDDGGCPIEHYEIEKYDVELGRWTRCGKAKGTEFEVTGLTPGKKYKFRVAAVNAEGESQPLENDREILAKNPYDVASEPKDVAIDDYDNKSAHLVWTKPDSDNGAPITGYIIEGRRKDSPDWVEMAKTIGPDCEGTVEGLVEGTELEFRVKAVNKAGPGSPSKPTPMHLVKYKNLKPKIDRKNLKNITIQAGKTYKYEVKVQGEPPAECKWYKIDKNGNETEVKNDEHNKIDNKDYLTEFTLKDALRSQTGKYKLVAQNINGTDEETVTINVISKPSKPKGPLAISKVHAEGCRLQWEAPDDDGGVPLKGYRIEKMDTRTGKYTRCGKTTEKEFDVTGLITGKEYLFRVVALNEEGESEPLEADHAIVAKNPFDISDAPSDLEIVDWDNKSCDLKWAAPLNDGNAQIQSYIVEQKNKIGDWVEVLQTDGPQTECKVEGLKEGEQVRFRVKAVNRAGVSKASEPTATHTVKHRNLKPYIERTNLVNTCVKSGKSIKFTAIVRGEPPPDCTWTFKNKDIAHEVNVRVHNKEYYTEIEITDIARAQSGLYTITAVNKNGSDDVTLELTVLSKPSKPLGPLVVSDVTKNGAHLSFEKPLDDGGSPIDHYECEKLDVETGKWTKCGVSNTPEFDVRGLVPGKEYKFRVIACNAEGDSDPLETDHSIIAKDPFSAPDAPEGLVIDDYDNQMCKLSWSPGKDNGAPISGYTVEMQLKGSKDWVPVSEVGSTPEATVKGLEEGSEVRFRVRARNKGGVSEPSLPTDMHTVRHKNLKPHIDRTNLKDVTIKVGRVLKLEAKVQGEPAPEVTYIDKNGKILSNDKHITIINPDYYTEFNLENAQRKHAGPLTIKAVNRNGEDTVTINLNVIGVPSGPEGPLKVSDIHAEGCHLSFKPPEDGGLPIDHYNCERFDPDSGRWIPCGKSKNTEFDVTGLTPGHEYKFRVMAVNPEGESLPLETLGSIIAKDPFDCPDRPGKPQLVDYDSDFVVLEWKAPVLDGGSPITGYIIEKKDRNSSTWTKAIETRGELTSAKVPDLTENQEYEFRVIACNKAGCSQPSLPSDLIRVRKKHHIPKIDLGNLKDIVVNAGDPINLDITVFGDPVPTIEWFINDEKQVPNDRILINNDEPEKSIFKVKEAKRDDTGKFKIVAKNKNGDDSAEIKVTVLDKPGAPEGVEASDVKATSCKLTITPPKDDGGTPISHYNIERLNPETGRWIPVGKSFKPEYEVTGLEPNTAYKFRVSAVNDRGESEPCETAKEVVTESPPGPPGKPDITDVDKNSVCLEWTPPTTKGSPITGYIIEKKEASSNKWVKALEQPGQECSAFVPNLIEGRNYQFRVKAISQAGEGAPSEPSSSVTTKPKFSPPGKPGVPDIVDYDNKSVDLKWMPGSGTPADYYVVEALSTSSPIWVEVGRSDSSIPEAHVDGLKEGEQMKFRVRGINRQGPGKPSDATDLHTVRHKNLKPYIDRTYLKDLDIVIGKNHRFTAKVAGEPCPKVVWTKAKIDAKEPGKDLLVEDLNVKVNNEDYYTELNLNNLERKHSGNYTVTATNKNGTDQVTIRLNVQDVPNKPENLEISNVHSSGCHLSWSAPRDDGGAKIEYYDISQYDVAVGKWTKCGRSTIPEFDVKTLQKDGEYKFKVTASNKIGESEPLESSGTIIARNPFDLPGAPTDVVIEDWDNESASLRFNPPADNGRSPITHYVVEMKSKAGIEWYPCGQSKGSVPEATVRGLKEGSEVQFRVRAVNKAGTGPASSPTDYHLVKHRNLKPYIDRKNLMDVTLKEGQNWQVSFDVKGEPAPKVEFFFGSANVPLSNDAHYTIRNRDYHSFFSIDNAQRKHTGPYNIRATNVNGSDELTITITVIAKPSPPEGPLQISNICSTGASLRWSAPKDDGGSPITHYVVEIQDCETPGLWTKAGITANEKFDLTGLTNGKQYKARVRAVNAEGVSEPLDGMRSFVAKNEFDPPSKPGKPIVKDFDKNYADLRWLPSVDNGGTPITGYIIEKKDRNSSTWKRAVQIDGDICEGRVSDLIENSQYEFRVIACNKAGESAPSDASEVFTARSRNVPPKISGQTSELFLIVGETLTLDFRLYGSPSPTVSWTFNDIPIKNDEQYNIDTNQDRSVLRIRGVKRDDTGTYNIIAKNSNGHDELTVKVTVIEPPSPPGVPDVTEIGGDFVNLQWTKPRDDGGSRILGYWVEKREKGMQAWQRVNSLVCHALQLNAPHLIENRDYEFRVMAFNKAGMSLPSEASKMVTVKDPKSRKPPEFITPLRNVYAIEGKPGEFSCTVTNVDNVTWYKGSRELVDGGRYTMLQEGERFSLCIRDIYGEDQAEYTCRASNSSGTRSSKADLLIKSAPKLNPPPRFRELAFFERGEDCVIKIPFTGFPKPQIKWSLNGEEIEAGAHFELEVKDRHAVLVIKDASRLDDGPYRIYAENEMGSDSAVINIKVSDRPDPPRHPMVEVIGDTYVNLSYKPPVWDGGSAITNYVIEKRTPSMDTWIRCANTRYLLHQVTGLSPEREYEFRVLAENIYGRSNPSEVTNKITTRPSETDKQKKKHWNFDADGKKVRGIEGDVDDYDRLVTPIGKIPAIPVDIKTGSVYDYYDILEEIGTGTYGVAHRGKDKRSGHNFAVKFVPATHPFEKSVLRKEIDIMNQLHHNNILRLTDAFEDVDEMITVHELISGEELFERAANDDYHMSEEKVVNFMKQICSAVRHMHEKNIIHLDLKPESFITTTSKSDDIKLVDFGLATKLDPKEMVKISTYTAEFAAPEICDKQSVGFYTDMWAVGVLAFTLLCGKSPFAGSTLNDTLNNIRNGTYNFSAHAAFGDVSAEGKDFISKLLLVKKDKRMTAHECLLHPWLKQDQGKASTKRIPPSNYTALRDAMRTRYVDYWHRVRIPLGHFTNYSALRKLREELKFLHDVYIDRRELAPRFVVRPVSTFAYEGQSANFYCRILSPSPAIITWSRDSCELKQSVKYMKRYAGTEYTFIINRTKTQDRGEYIIRAENFYGYREEPAFLNVHPRPTQLPSFEPLPDTRRSKRGPKPPVWLDEPPSGPTFTFQLRPRIIQVGIGVKLLACYKSNPSCDVQWRKDGRVLSKSEYNQTSKDGVVTLEITSCSLEDAGKYTCTVENHLGSAESTCVLIVDKKF